MELTDDLIEFNRQIDLLIFEEMLLSKIAYWLLGAMCLVFLIIAIVKLIKRKWRSVFLIAICLITFAWSLFSLFILHFDTAVFDDHYDSFRLIALVPIPALFALHIHRQVSYKPVRPLSIVFYIALPSFIIFVLSGNLYASYTQSGIAQFPSAEEGKLYIFFFYAAVATINSYLLCFNVFYQMPPRARRSTRSMLISVITLTLLLFAYAAWEISFADNIPQDSMVLRIILPPAIPVALMFFIYPLFDSMSIMPATDVIVTSREFVMKGLSTTVIVLSRNQLILDWNRKDWGAQNPLPKPIYKEHYSVYRKRVLQVSMGRLSPHSSDIFILKANGDEYHFLQSIHEVGNRKSKLGYIVEIAEVSPIYTKLRYFEEIAHFDTLTGLYNRNAYIDYTNNALKDSNFPLLVIAADINKLKQINDHHGHLEGDSLIKSIAASIDSIKPSNSFFARVGGDEFVLLIPNSSEEFAEEFISGAIEACGPVPYSEEFMPAVSWGYALMTSSEQSYNDVFFEADKMMYEFKKNRYQFSSGGILPPKA